jgi:glutamate-1-semialdehyde 2,1-aminomutase
MSTDNLVNDYVKTHAHSQSLHRRATKLFAADGATHTARISDPFRPYITHAAGAYKWDEDGNRYIDYILGHGALLLGHSHPDIVHAVQEQAGRGFHYGDNHELEIEWAELILSMIPSMERVEFFSCGQEANYMAIKLARNFTGRKKILRFEENFHGWIDELAPPGTPGLVNSEVTIIPMNELDSLEKALSTREYAILMTEGGGGHMGGQIPWNNEFIRAIPGLTGKYGTVWLIDEVVTCFRDAPGGWQSIVDVTPELTSLGKTVCGGLGAGALGGRADIMDILRPKPSPQPFVPHSGTWNANPLSSAAGKAACRLYQGGNVQTKVNELANYFKQKGNRLLLEHGINGHLYGRSIVHLYLGPIDYEPEDDTLPPTHSIEKLTGGLPLQSRLGLHLLQRGISTMGARLFIMSTAHTKDDIDRTLDALAVSLDAMRSEGEFSGL